MPDRDPPPTADGDVPPFTIDTAGVDRLFTAMFLALLVVEVVVLVRRELANDDWVTRAARRYIAVARARWRSWNAEAIAAREAPHLVWQAWEAIGLGQV